MIELNTEKLRELASKMTVGIDGDRTVPISELLEIELKDKVLTLKTTNKEYFLETFIENVTDSEEYFHATILADIFLTLVTKTTTKTIKLKKVDGGLQFIGNGTYTFSLSTDGENEVKLTKIPFEENDNTIKFKMSGDILKSIYEFNSKELSKEVASDQILRYYYMDENGAITYIENACINEFKLPQPLKVLFNERLVQLFKLFGGSDVDFALNKIEVEKDDNGNSIFKNVVKITKPSIELVAILQFSDIVNRYPAIDIRTLSEVEYPAQIKVNKQDLLGILERLSIFDKRGTMTADIKKCGHLKFGKTEVTITNVNDGNFESLPYLENSNPVEFENYVSMAALSKHLNISKTENAEIHYGTGDALMIVRNGLKQIIPEMSDPTSYLEGN